MLRVGAVRILLLSCALTCTVAACGDALGPGDVAGTYVLRAPTFPAVTSGDSSWRLLADTFVVRGDRTATKDYWIQIVRLSTNDTTRLSRTAEYSFLIDTHSIGFLAECQIGSSCGMSDYREWYELSPGAGSMRARGQPDARYVRIGAGAP